MEKQINEILSECRKYTKDGKVASYIPKLQEADPEALGICVMTKEGKMFSDGNCSDKFTIQSISKVLILLMALMDNGQQEIVERIGVEATGKPFNAIDYSEQLILREHINPMVNIGAIAMCYMVNGKDYEERFERIIEFGRKIMRNDSLTIDEEVYLSERDTGDKNRALGYLLKSSKIIDGNVDDLMDMYFKMCSIKVDCADLANFAMVLANGGKSVYDGTRIIPAEYARFTNAVLSTCGMYDGSGGFAVRVGVPAKSGVGGGIMAVVPNRMGIGIYSPSLDKKGNSVAGMKVLEKMSREFELSLY